MSQGGGGGQQWVRCRGCGAVNIPNRLWGDAAVLRGHPGIRSGRDLNLLPSNSRSSSIPGRTVRPTRGTLAALRDHVTLPVLALAVIAGASPFNTATAIRGGALVCLLSLLPRVGRLRIGRAEAWAVALAVFSAMSITWALNPQGTQVIAAYQFALLAIFLTGRFVITNRLQLVVIAWGYVVGCVYAVILVVRENPDARFVAALSATRYGIDEVNFNYLGYSLATGIAVVVFLWTVGSTRRWTRAVLVGAALVMGFGILQAGSRGAVVAAILVVVWVPLHRFLPRRGIAVLCATIAVAAVAILSGVATSGLLAADASSARSTGDLANRLVIWPLARETFAGHWLLGIGAGGFKDTGPLWVGAHNAVLELGTGLGVVGVVMFVGVIACSLITGTRGAPKRTILVGSLLACWAPMWLSGHWDQAPAAWIVMALFSRIDVLATDSAMRTFEAKHRACQGAKPGPGSPISVRLRGSCQACDRELASAAVTAER